MISSPRSLVVSQVVPANQVLKPKSGSYSGFYTFIFQVDLKILNKCKITDTKAGWIME